MCSSILFLSCAAATVCAHTLFALYCRQESSHWYPKCLWGCTRWGLLEEKLFTERLSSPEKALVTRPPATNLCAFVLILSIMGSENPSPTRRSNWSMSLLSTLLPFTDARASYIPSGWNPSTLPNTSETFAFSIFAFLLFLSCSDRSGLIRWSANLETKGQNSSNTS